MPRLTKLEIECVLAAAGNVDPCMFEDEAPDGKRGEALAQRQVAALDSGIEKLRMMLASRVTKPNT